MHQDSSRRSELLKAQKHESDSPHGSLGRPPASSPHRANDAYKPRKSSPIFLMHPSALILVSVKDTSVSLILKNREKSNRQVALSTSGNTDFLPFLMRHTPQTVHSLSSDIMSRQNSISGAPSRRVVLFPFLTLPHHETRHRPQISPCTRHNTGDYRPHHREYCSLDISTYFLIFSL